MSNLVGQINTTQNLAGAVNTTKIDVALQSAGINGKGLEFVWDGTRLGVRREGEIEYIYTDLKPAGIGEAFIISGTLENTSWSGTEAPYTKEVTVTGIVGSGKPPVIDVVLSTTWSTAMTEEKQWSNIKRVAYADDKLTFYATAVPSVSLNFKGVQVK